ncbi:MAG: hypothetical protein ACFE7R_03220 [Candidatus Hodarchaeota archaeon]
MNEHAIGIEAIKNPENIREAVYASSPRVLRMVFDNDPIVRRLIGAGQKIIPLIERELEDNRLNLHEITLACYAYILQKVDEESARRILTPHFLWAMEKPGVFFVHFAATPLRKGTNLEKKPLGVTLTLDELNATLKLIDRKNRSVEG